MAKDRLEKVCEDVKLKVATMNFAYRNKLVKEQVRLSQSDVYVDRQIASILIPAYQEVLVRLEAIIESFPQKTLPLHFEQTTRRENE